MCPQCILELSVRTSWNAEDSLLLGEPGNDLKNAMRTSASLEMEVGLSCIGSGDGGCKGQLGLTGSEKQGVSPWNCADS